MLEPERECAVEPSYYGGDIGEIDGGGSSSHQPKYRIVQSLWTKPCKDKEKLKNLMFICALSLAYAHRSGYKVHMHTDTKGATLLRSFGYDKLATTLNKIPDTVPEDLFAAGKFYAMEAEGRTGFVHTDVDVFIKKPLLHKFYENKNIDAICQMEEDLSPDWHNDKVYHMHILGYPDTTRPNWRGSMNTGAIGFNNKELADKYFNNYWEALKIYTKEIFDEHKQKYGCDRLLFDFVLEQIQLSFLSLNYNVHTILPMKNFGFVATEIGFTHLWGNRKWKEKTLAEIKQRLQELDRRLFTVAKIAASKIK